MDHSLQQQKKVWHCSQLHFALVSDFCWPYDSRNQRSELRSACDHNWIMQRKSWLSFPKQVGLSGKGGCTLTDKPQISLLEWGWAQLSLLTSVCKAADTVRSTTPEQSCGAQREKRWMPQRSSTIMACVWKRCTSISRPPGGGGRANKTEIMFHIL